MWQFWLMIIFSWKLRRRKILAFPKVGIYWDVKLNEWMESRRGWIYWSFIDEMAWRQWNFDLFALNSINVIQSWHFKIDNYLIIILIIYLIWYFNNHFYALLIIQQFYLRIIRILFIFRNLKNKNWIKK